MTRTRILLVDDEPGVRLGMRGYLTAHGFDVDEAQSLAEAQEVFRTHRPDVAVVDYRLTDGTALELLPRLKEIDAAVPLVVLTGHGSIELAVQAVKEGAEQFLTKPVELAVLKVVLERLVAQRRERQRLRADLSRTARASVDPFLGQSVAIQNLRAEAERMQHSDSPVLVTGETGSGKSVLARWLHEGGPRADAPFVDLNCAALSRDLLDSELFGHEKGAFTGAVANKQGLLEVADRGTLFLDEIGDMDLTVQPKLLKVLEEKRFRRLGDVRDRRVDVRLIAATHQDLGTATREKRFRSDLYFRVSTLILHVPALRERPEDISVLARSFLAEMGTARGRGGVGLQPDAETALMRYAWPGNIRELRNVLERAVLLSGGGALSRGDLRFESSPDEPTAEDDLTLEELERRHIERVLRRENGHVERAAVRLGIPRSSLYERLKRLGINRSGFQKSDP
ncbi:two component, sigma54 specific, transcriptional regulator, Fis family [Myxococcus fulvus]|uniref:Two component, sigma54 specific, transcriptional regulator, Fis family n=1 Tax=Myxococcus fulvus TaxID=33 RepID=A0A511TE57_MYXFU|nr:sigma-54 dependent transcriptional regulator [Myxococcus fulvus]GEN11468.1 two-component system response regulator [Myxococcus fulvus]SEU13136.1 two component, sigma54 specific, transcriptional regulator, Fis family [Myxococcus fulvus]